MDTNSKIGNAQSIIDNVSVHLGQEEAPSLLSGKLELIPPKRKFLPVIPKILQPEGKYTVTIEVQPKSPDTDIENGYQDISKLKFDKDIIIFESGFGTLSESGTKLTFDPKDKATTALVPSFNPRAIKGCSLTLDRDYTFMLRYRYIAKDEKTGTKVELSKLSKGLGLRNGWNEVKLTLKEMKPVPHFSIRYHGPSTEYLYDDTEEHVHIGQITVSHSSTLPCAPQIDGLKLKLSTLEKPFTNDKDCDSKFTLAKDNIFRIGDDKQLSDSAPIGTLKPGESKVYRLFYIPSRAQNPICLDTAKESKAEYKPQIGYADSQTSANASDDMKYKLSAQDFMPITIKGNKNICQFQATLYAPDLSYPNGKPYDLLKANIETDLGDTPLEITPTGNKRNAESHRSTEKIHLDIVLSNAAPIFSSKSQVVLWDVSLEPKKLNERIVLADGVKPTDAFKLYQVVEEDHMPKLVDFPTEDTQTVHLYGGTKEGHLHALKLRIVIDPKNFKDIKISDKQSAVSVTLKLKFKKYDDRTGEYTYGVPEVGEEFFPEIKFKLRRRPNEKWLSVDFGTSAIVATYGDKQIDLRELKQKLYKGAYPKEDKKHEVDEAENLINSNICFNSTSNAEICYDEIDGSPFAKTKVESGVKALTFPYLSKLPLWLSPSKHTFDKNWMLPCLKLLVGYQYMPHIFKDKDLLEGVKYRTSDGTEAFLCQEIDGEIVGTELMKVETIFTQTYRQLFYYYVKRHTDDEINRLVLSVPNTYSTLQTGQIMRIARQAIPSIFPEYIDVVSESDAVAYYYALHQRKFHKSLPNNDKRRNLEHVLIYDMGAGTLDLTYFTIKHIGDKTEVDIINKSGIVKAGNYLDYILAKIFTKLLVEKKIYELLDDETPDSSLLTHLTSIAPGHGATMRDRLLMRDYIRNIVKPTIAKGDNSAVIADFNDATVNQLSGDDQGLNTDLHLNYEYKENGQKKSRSLKVADFTHDEEFKAYINEIAKRYIEDFAKDIVQNTGSLSIDTVIFSGRSSCLSQVRTKVDDTIKHLMSDPNFANADFTQVKYANLAEKSLTDNPLGNTKDERNVTVLKNIVSQGTIAYASIKHFEGSGYELLTKNAYAKYGIVLTGDAGEEPEWHQLRKTGNNTYEAEVDTDITRRYISLVETYDASPRGILDKAKAFDEKVRDSFNVLYSAKINQKGTIKFILEIYPGEEKPLILKYGGRNIDLSSVFQNFSSESLRQSLWPIAYPVEKN